MAEQNNDLIAGRNAVSEALRSQRSINKILLQEGAGREGLERVPHQRGYRCGVEAERE